MSKLQIFRLSILAGTCAILAGAWVVRAHAEEDDAPIPPPVSCTEKEATEAKIHAKNGRWIMVTTDQWEFLRGVYAVNPKTPPGMPPGDRAVLAQIDDDAPSVVFFIDGQLACNPMVVPPELVKVLREVDAKNVAHVGSGS